ncbi:hypothetical protein [Cytobacillus oceanisediminis]|uniref:hypothetical protein n=1 Tax=Cytobacillus oceanisediminis TaxID=665099 RepID=UPI00203BC579|nr:hypothetical protein [Cytobacillus oceanisediminis]MCM3393128.1 hypothetical protein [Cytobacillus oceanisediminis]
MALRITDISAIQYAELKKALGLSNGPKRPTKNSYYANEPLPIWEDLIVKNFAIKLQGNRPGEIYYVVTYDAVKLIYRKNISLDYYLKL